MHVTCLSPWHSFYIRLRHYHVTENELPPYAHFLISLLKSIYLSMCQFYTAYFWFEHFFSFCSFRDKEQILRPTVEQLTKYIYWMSPWTVYSYSFGRQILCYNCTYRIAIDLEKCWCQCPVREMLAQSKLRT
jgi:hypothetical protein